MSLTETEAGLTATRTPTLVDPDAAGALGLEVRSVKVFLTDAPPDSAALTTTGGLDDAGLAALGLSREEVIDWLELRPSSGDGFVGTGDGNVTWTFDSGEDAFEFLAEGEVLTIHCDSIRPDDGHGPTFTGDGGLVVRITGDDFV